MTTSAPSPQPSKAEIVKVLTGLTAELNVMDLVNTDPDRLTPISEISSQINTVTLQVLAIFENPQEALEFTQPGDICSIVDQTREFIEGLEEGYINNIVGEKVVLVRMALGRLRFLHGKLSEGYNEQLDMGYLNDRPVTEDYFPQS